MTETDFEPIYEFLWYNDMELTQSELPGNLCFKIILWLILDTDHNFGDDEIFDMEDSDTKSRVNQMRKLLEVGESQKISEMELSDFLAYVRSDKPNL